MKKEVKKQSKKRASAKTPAKTAKLKRVKKAIEKPSKKTDKNVSRKVPNGRTIKTKDKYLPIDKKGKSTKPKEKRLIIIIDSNSNDELAVVRTSTQIQPNTTALPTYKKGNKKKTRFKHFVEITDNEGNPIKIDGIKFIENGKEYDLSANEVETVRDKVLNHCKIASENRKKITKLKQKK
ncbi:MAG: hypothetical protein K2N23_06085 [Clostridia bacterium]|nr:hypothetical protein [Clostridia bacterium]